MRFTRLKDALAAAALAVAISLLVPIALLAQSPDPGGGVTADPVQAVLDSIVPVIVGALAGPAMTWLAKKLPIGNLANMGAVLNMILTTALYAVGWAVLAHADSKQLPTYLMWAMIAAGLGSAGNNAYRKTLGPGGGS